MTAKLIPILVGVLLTRVFATAAQSGKATNNPPTASLPRTDVQGNPLRRAPGGHVSNYDEAKVGTYTLPDPMVLQSGKPVRTAEQWLKERRAQIIKLYETEIY